jgi:hypothetical protein
MQDNLLPGRCRNCGCLLTMDNYLGRMRHFNAQGKFLYDTEEWKCLDCGEVNVDRITLNDDREA